MNGLDQGFSPKNLKKIFDYEKRKGNQIESRFDFYYQNVISISGEIQDKVKERGEKYKELSTRKKNKSDYSDLSEAIRSINNEIDGLKDLKDIKILEVLDNVSKNINNKNFSIGLDVEFNQKTKKYVYVVNNHDSFYCIKQLQYNINKIYKVKQSNRYNIVNGLKSLLNDEVPKNIVKVDISNFYENVSFDNIISKLENDGLLSFFSRKVLIDINKKYKELSNSSNGLPRGLGISAYLSELYMRDFDNILKKLDGVYFYARYVDDIILITESNNIDYIAKISNNLNSLGLNINTIKSKMIKFPDNLNDDFDYLGYNFNFEADKKLNIDLSSNKIKKYKEKIDLAFHNYKFHNLKEKKAKNLLLKRLRYLTSNTRLLGRKKNIKTGILYSNSLINRDISLVELDDYIKLKTSSLNSTFLKGKIGNLSFKKGFYNKRFFLLKNKKYFTNHLGQNIELKEDQFKKIIKIWKYV